MCYELGYSFFKEILKREVDGMKRWKKALLSAAVLGVAAFGFSSVGVQQAKASNLYGVCSANTAKYWELKGGKGTFYYGIAYEIYDQQAGASSIHARLAVRIDHELYKGDTLNLWLNNAKFNQDQTVYYALVVDNESTNAVNAPTPATVATDLQSIPSLKVNAYTAASSGLGYRIAAITSSTISTPTDSLGLKVDNATGLNKNKFLYLVQVTKPDPNVDNYTFVSLGSGINVASGLDAACGNHPEIDIHFTAPNDSASNKVFAIIEPKCGPFTIGKDLRNLGAELDTDNDFKYFLGGPAVVDKTDIDTCGTACATSSCDGCDSGCGNGNGNEGGSCGPTWIVGNDLVCDEIEGTISFTLKSVAPEDGVTVQYQSNKCTPNGDNTQWTCTANGVTLANGGCIKINIDGKTSLTPTAWTISNLTVTPGLTGTNVKHVCVNTSEGDAGSWYGGLEAIVPFVKSGNGYETYIKLFNRYDKDAKVFAASFKNGGSGSVMIALTQVGTIPAGGELQLTGADLAKDLNLTDDQIAYGVPVKFMIMVPSQKGCQNVSGKIDNATWTITQTACYNNANDPYVEGIVVSVTPQGQRSIPLEFKYFKNGSYVQ